MLEENKQEFPQLKNATLCDVCEGDCVRVKCLQGKKGDCLRLREMGIFEEAYITKIADNGALICGVNDSRVIISESLAKNVVVERPTYKI